MRGRVTEPIRDDQGNVIGLRGYKIDPHADGEAIIVVGDDGNRKRNTSKRGTNNRC